jgi:DNA-binding transcriptional LysR family regulator
MNEIDIRAINLNLLPALEALLMEGSVSAAARRLHVSQSAMSHSLSRLRDLFGDPLLAPLGRGLTPTPRALQLRAALPTVFEQLRRALASPEPFDPCSSTRVYRVATVDYFELTTLPDVLAYLGKHAPFVRLEIERFTPETVPSLVLGDVDLALIGATHAVPPAGLRRAAIYKDPFAVIAREGHPAIKRHLDLETYVALGHVLVSVEGRRDGVVDRALARLGTTRRVALRVPHFMSAPLAVRSSDLICTIASSVAHRAHQLFGLRVLPPPIELPAAQVVALWSQRHDEDPAQRWFRDLFLSGRALSPQIRALLRDQRA